MIKTIFKPFFKRFFGLFISMAFVSMLAVGLLCCFGSCIVNVRDNFETFVKDYQDVDELISTGFTTREKLLSVSELDEVEQVDARLVIDCYLRKGEESENSNERMTLARVFSYSKEDDVLFKCASATGYEKVWKDNEVNIAVAEKFAKNNKFKPGQTIKLGFLEMFADFNIAEIVDTPEGIYPRANNYIWTNNSDFGYIYVEKDEINKLLKILANKIMDDPVAKAAYETAQAELKGLTIPSLEDVINYVDFAGTFANQALVKNIKGKNTEDVLSKAKKFYEDKNVKVTSTVVRDYLPHMVYMNHALEQVQIVSIFLPLFFYSITMIVVGLFINQIIKTMTPQIGIFMSIGIDNNEIVRLFLLFTTIMGLTAAALGIPTGFLLSILMSTMMKNTYSIPTITPGLNVFVTLGAVIGLMIFIVVTTLIATRAIFRITPKDATISNESKRKKLPKALERFIDKAPMNIKLGVNSIAQNPRRFFVSSFSIFASLVLILLSSFFYVSKNEMIDQSVNRRLRYDCQIYLTQKEEDQDFIDGLRAKSKGGDEFEECYYTYLKVDDSETYLECLAVDPEYNPLINIPNKTGGHYKKTGLIVQEEGVILPKTSADALHVKKGGKIKINGHKVTVTDISFQYFHPITYLSKKQMSQISDEYVTSFILNVEQNKTGELLRYLSKNRTQSLAVFTDALSKDLHNIFDSTDSMIYIMIAFSLVMAFIILCIMSQNALMEQQRQLTIFRAVGFTVLDISNIWTLQSIAQLFVSSLFGVPIGAVSIYILLKMCSSSTQIYPFIFSWVAVLVAIGFVLLVVVGCHLLSMRSISKWNIADNTRSRE